MMPDKSSFFPYHNHGQSAIELAIFGSILMFVIALIFRQGFEAGNFMNSQLKAERFAMSKSLEMAELKKPGRNNASVLVIEDRLGGDFGNKFGSRDRNALVANGTATFSSQLFYPVEDPDYGDTQTLTHFDLWVNGQKFSFLTAKFNTVNVPTDKGGLADCGTAHPTDTRCWRADCLTNVDDPTGPRLGCVVFHKMVQNYPGSDFNPGGTGFDLDFDGVADVPATNPYNNSEQYLKNNNTGTTQLGFMWQWREVPAINNLDTTSGLDVDGDFYEEQVLSNDKDHFGRVTSIRVIDHQDGDLNFSIDSRNPNAQVGLVGDSQMLSFTRDGTALRIQAGKLFDVRTDRYVRSVNRNDQIDIVQRIFQLSNDTGRFCNGNTPYPQVDGATNPVEACNNCFSSGNIQFTCFDQASRRIFIRSRIQNSQGRSWTTRTEVGP